MEKAYQPQDFEERLYTWWEAQGYFKAKDSDPERKPFSIMIPPPNVTGALHNGHALFVTLQDILTRWKRMKGFNTLWLPGTDHAGIATQMMVERDLQKSEKKSRHDLGREKFVERIWAWKEKHGGVIQKQIRILGASVDWERERFTLDEGLSRAVREVFVRLYEQGLIYRGSYIINWCHRCQTALSDLEVIPKEKQSSLWHLKYTVAGSNETVTIATTRPETLMGDTAVAVNPKDERFKHLVGKKLILPLVNRQIPVIADEHVDMEFGTGALKVTPGHDFNDYEIGKRHSLPIVNILNRDGTLNDNAGAFKGQKIGPARDAVVAALTEKEILVKAVPHTLQAGTCERCETVVEPMVSEQWFVKAEPLAKPALQAVRKGMAMSGAEVDQCTDAIRIYPESWAATYYHFLDNIRDWCISRQLWWGHQIPAWHCDKCKKISVSRDDLNVCGYCGNSSADSFRRDEDVLDTWFSSALWPFSTLGWPEKTDALKTFYPTSVLETGHDILFFWVARMIMMGMHFMDGKVPFHRVYLHSLVRDEKGQKMSKTKGNVVDPLVVVKEYGADAFRFTLASMAGPNRDIRLSLTRVAEDRAFCNKLWNASRYVLMRLGVVPAPVDETTGKPIAGIAPAGGTVVDFEALTQGESLQQWIEGHRSQMHPVNRWILSQQQKALVDIENALEEFRVCDATAALYHFTWDHFCDWYIEYTKVLLQGAEDGASALIQETYVVMLYTLESLLKMAHPLIPFITEEIFQSLPQRVGHEKGSSLMIQSFPEFNASWIDTKADDLVDLWTDLIGSVRAFRGENNISPKARPQLSYEMLTAKEHLADAVTSGAKFVRALAGIDSFGPETGALKGQKTTGEIVTKCATLFVPLEGLVDFAAEKKRLEKELASAQKDIEFFEKKLGNESFVSKAPAEVIAEQREKLAAAKQKRDTVEKSLARLP
jgi:valyl-tRNA synthetase